MEMYEGSSMINFIKKIKEIKTNSVVVGEILIDNILVHASFNDMPSSYEFWSYQSHLVIFCHHLTNFWQVVTQK